MNIHEYQAKQLLAKYNVAIPKGYEAFSAEDAKKAAEKLASKVIVLKAQIHAGGRGKAGGVKILKSSDEVYECAKKMLGMTLITHQTTSEGKIVNRLYVEEGSEIAKEYYLGMVVDRETSSITIIASTEGGIEIEEVAINSPDKILKVHIDPTIGIQEFHIRKLAYQLNLDKSITKDFNKFVKSLYQAFIDTDASQIEINPLVLTKQNQFITLDAKINFDDNALYRQPEILALRDEDEEEPLERQAMEANLSYVKMDGNIGCMVNGAGLAMATMDIIKLYGAEPANFLDVGGGASKEKVTTAFKIILSDKNVEAILVNIFGGIMRCDIIAEGIIAAAKEVNLHVPLVVRLAGTNFEQGQQLLNNSGLKIIAANDLGEAADKIVKSI